MNEFKNIIIFSASEAFTKVSDNVIKKNNLSELIEIIEMTGEGIIDVAQMAVQHGTKAFIARGRNVNLLRENIPAPVINVQYTYEDIYYSIQKSKYKCENIALIGFDEAFEAMKNFKEVSGCNAQIIQPKTVDSMENDILSALSTDIKSLIGGISVKKVAALHNLEHVMLDVNESSIEMAVNSALNILESQDEKDQYLQTILTTINGTSEAIININKDGETIFLNNKAKKIFSNSTDRETNKILFSTIDKDIIFKSKNPIFDKVLTIKNKNYIANFKPVIVNNKVQSVVVIILDANFIQSSEKQLRLTFNTKGRTAKNTFDNVIGKSSELANTIYKAKKYSKSNCAVLITGETGTGKEIFAQSMHNYSDRANEPFVAINCAALPSSILESELFGYVKGAFTGAKDEGKIGIFELAHNGTVFLDEIGEMDINIQAKILRVLQEKEVSRLGDNKIIPIDVRIISATNKDLHELIKEKKFREDLYYRLGVLELNLPPLNERLDDIPYLVDYYLKKNNYDVSFSNNAIELLCSGSYPGNVRQLFNILERAIVLADSRHISSEDFKNIIDINNFEAITVINDNSLKNSNKNHESSKIIRTLEKYNGDRKKTSQELNISLTTLWRKMKKYDIIYDNEVEDNFVG